MVWDGLRRSRLMSESLLVVVEGLAKDLEFQSLLDFNGDVSQVVSLAHLSHKK